MHIRRITSTVLLVCCISAQAQEPRFKPSIVWDGRIKGTWRFSIQEYKSSDGRVFVRTEIYETKSQANRRLRERLKQASKIVEQEPKLDQGGRQVGKRVVAMFLVKGQEKARPEILWTDGARFYSISSDSIEWSAEVEKYYHRVPLSNKRMQPSAVSKLHMACTCSANLQQRAG